MYPIFYKTACHFIKQYSDSQCVFVLNTESQDPKIEQIGVYIFESLSLEQSTIDEFIDAYSVVRNKLDELSL